MYVPFIHLWVLMLDSKKKRRFGIFQLKANMAYFQRFWMALLQLVCFVFKFLQILRGHIKVGEGQGTRCANVTKAAFVTSLAFGAVWKSARSWSCSNRLTVNLLLGFLFRLKTGESQFSKSFCFCAIGTCGLISSCLLATVHLELLAHQFFS